ncbi:MAG: divergent polysaccharide deacetylase family protein, partial [Dongiaceae bacterium]
MAAAILTIGTLWALEPDDEAPGLSFEAQAPQPLAAEQLAPVAEQPAAAEPAPIPDFAATDLEPARDVLALLPAAGQPVADEQPTWMRNAVAIPDAGGRPMIAIVIDDLGLDRRNTDRVVGLPGPLTLAFMTYAGDVASQAQVGRDAGHELLVHVPMAPDNGHLATGPNVLSAGLAPDELKRRIDWVLSRFDGHVGLNNHMGSRFTADAAGMAVLFEELQRRGLLFLDSRTTAATVADAMAMRYDVPFVRRNVFLENETSAGEVEAQLGKVEAEARRTGLAVAIGHPHD